MGTAGVKMIIGDTAAFGAAIRKRRRELGYTQSFLSGFTGYSISFISDLENGKATAELGRALDIAHVLGMDIDLKVRD